MIHTVEKRRKDEKIENQKGYTRQTDQIGMDLPADD
jgi:hypothetical protein